MISITFGEGGNAAFDRIIVPAYANSLLSSMGAAPELFRASFMPARVGTGQSAHDCLSSYSELRTDAESL